MPRAERTQIDGHNDEYSAATGIHFDPDDDFTRQEFKDDADLNVLLKRFGAFAPIQATPYGGEADFDVGLQEAFQRVQEAREAFQTLPARVQAQYGDWEALAASIARGETRIELLQKEEPAPDVSSGGGASSPPAGVTPSPATTSEPAKAGK